MARSGAVEGERHIDGLEMAASALLHAGFDVRMLGADVPDNAISWAVARLQPAVLGLTATVPDSAWHVREAMELSRGEDQDLGIVVGGAAAEQALYPNPRSALCMHVGDAVELFDALAQRASMN